MKYQDRTFKTNVNHDKRVKTIVIRIVKLVLNGVGGGVDPSLPLACHKKQKKQGLLGGTPSQLSNQKKDQCTSITQDSQTENHFFENSPNYSKASRQKNLRAESNPPGRNPVLKPSTTLNRAPHLFGLIKIHISYISCNTTKPEHF